MYSIRLYKQQFIVTRIFWFKEAGNTTVRNCLPFNTRSIINFSKFRVQTPRLNWIHIATIPMYMHIHRLEMVSLSSVLLSLSTIVQSCRLLETHNIRRMLPT